MEEIIKDIIFFGSLAVIAFSMYMIIKDPKIEKKGHK